MSGFQHEFPFGAMMQPDGSAVFRLWAPSVVTVTLEIAGRAPLAMERAADGYFIARAPDAVGAHYRYRLPDGLAVPDPAARAQDGDVHAHSIVVDPLSYKWEHPSWRGRPWAEAVICEMHVGACGGYDGVAARLPALHDLGITAVELMPIAEFPGARNWGYDGVLPYAPEASYGSPEALKRLIDTAHGLGLMVMLDVVYNHFGPDGNFLHAYAQSFFHEEVQTPWGAAIDFSQPAVSAFFLHNALYWLREYRFDGLRFDAVHQIHDPHFLPALAAGIRAGTEPGRHVHLVLENENNAAGLLEGAFDAQWNDDFHHCVHVLLTGESEGYYEDFADPAPRLARALSSGFVYQGDASRHHQGAPRGTPSAHLPTTAFVNCLQNHDQIGNRAFGERLTRLASPEALMAASALLLLAPMIPMLFMGEEWGCTAPFLFFTDHHAELADLVREGRRREFQHFAAFADAESRARIPDPNAPETFAASIADPAQAAQAPHAAILAQYRTLLALRKAHVVPGISGCHSTGARALGAHAIAAGWRLGNGAHLTLTTNFAADPVAFTAPSGVLIFGAMPQAGWLPEYTTLAFLAAPEHGA
jgi:maltooligosyltrehalose trehalohydrolase